MKHGNKCVPLETHCLVMASVFIYFLATMYISSGIVFLVNSHIEFFLRYILLRFLIPLGLMDLPVYLAWDCW